MREKNYKEAEKLLRRALDGTITKGLKIGVGTRQIDLGYVSLFQGDLESATSYFKSALQSSQEMYRQESIAKAELGLARVYAKQGKITEARQMAINAREQFERLLMPQEFKQADQLIQELMRDEQG